MYNAIVNNGQKHCVDINKDKEQEINSSRFSICNANIYIIGVAGLAIIFKILTDKPRSNRFFAKLFDLNVSVVNEVEMWILQIVNYNVNIHYTEYLTYKNAFR
jgi:hypothetical protein